MANKSLIWRNIKQNFKSHLLFFIIHTFFGMVYLWSEMLISHPWFGKFLHAQEITNLGIDQIRVWIILFILLSAGYQIAVRRGTATPDMLDAVSLKQMRLVIFWENFILGLLSWITSIIFGWILSLPLFPVFAVLMETPVFPFVFPAVSIGKSALLFLSAFLLHAFFCYLFLYPKKNVWKIYGKWQSYTWVIVSVLMLLGLYVFAPFGKLGYGYSLLLGIFFVAVIALLMLLDKKIGYTSIFSSQRFLGGRTGKIVVGFFAVLSLVSSIQDMKILLSSYQSQRDYYQENAFTFYLEALYQDKSQLPRYEKELEAELIKRKVTYEKTQIDFLVLRETNGERSPLTLSYSEYEKVAKLLGQPKPAKLNQNEAIYMFTSVNSHYLKRSETDKKWIAVNGYPTAFQLRSKSGSFIPGYDVMVVADEVYEEIRSIRTPLINYSVPDRYVLYRVPVWMSKHPTYTSEELKLGTKLIHQIEGSSEFVSDQDHILNGYVGENKNYELTVRSPYGMGVNDIRFLFLSVMKSLIGLLLLLFLYDKSRKYWWISFYYPLVVAVIASFLFSIDKISITSVSVCIQVIWIHLLFCFVSKKRFNFYR